MRPEVQVLPGPLEAAPACRSAGWLGSVEEVRVKKPLVLAAIVAAVAAIVAKRRQSQSDAAALWHEATSDASR